MTKARIMLLLTVIFWGWTFVATKVALAYMTPIELLALRFLTGMPILLAVILIKRIKYDFTGRDHRTVLIGSAVITVHFIIQITGINYTSATNTGWIISVTPLVMAVLAFLFLKEKIGRGAIMGIGVATIGIALLVSGGDVTNIGWLGSVGDWLVLGSAHTWAIYTVVTRDLSRTKNPLMTTFAVLTPSALIVWVYVAFTSDLTTFVNMPAEAVWAVLFLGVLGLAIAHWFWQEGVAKLGAARSGFFLYIEPLATTALAETSGSSSSAKSIRRCTFSSSQYLNPESKMPLIKRAFSCQRNSLHERMAAERLFSASSYLLLSQRCLKISMDSSLRRSSFAPGEIRFSSINSSSSLLKERSSMVAITFFPVSSCFLSSSCLRM